MKKVYCDECGKYLFSSKEENKGGVAAEAERKGFVIKMPAFYGVFRFKIFCDKKCKDAWFAKLPKEDLEKGNKKATEFKAEMQQEIPKITEKAIKAAEKFRQLLLSYQSKNKRR